MAGRAAGVANPSSEIAYKGEQVSIKGTLRGQTLSVSQFDVQLPDQPQPIKLVGEFTLPLVPDGVPVKGHAVATFNVPQLTSLVDADLDWEDNQGQLVVMARQPRSASRPAVADHGATAQHQRRALELGSRVCR